MTSSLSRYKGSDNRAYFKADSDINFADSVCPLFILSLYLWHELTDNTFFLIDWL